MPPAAMDYDHSCQTLTSVSTPDPFMVQANGQYYFVSFPYPAVPSYSGLRPC